MLFSGSDDSITQWDCANGPSHIKVVRTLDNPVSADVFALALDSQGRLFSGYGSSIQVWFVEDGAVVTVLDFHQASVSSLAMHGRVLVSGSDQTVAMWCLDSLSLITSLNVETRVQGVAMSVHGVHCSW
eukprot:m.3235 g.3235  ORF g.3235 m.3235 type:complete len:129 (+) comp2166_c0_seq1:55-441(+)